MAVLGQPGVHASARFGSVGSSHLGLLSDMLEPRMRRNHKPITNANDHIVKPGLVLSGSAVVEFHLDNHRTILRSKTMMQGNWINLPIGFATAVERYFLLGHTPPLPAQLEAAIDAIEDAVSSPVAPFEVDGLLSVGDADLQVLARLESAFDTNQRLWHRNQVESVFNRLCALSDGRPPPAIRCRSSRPLWPNC